METPMTHSDRAKHIVRVVQHLIKADKMDLMQHLCTGISDELLAEAQACLEEYGLERDPFEPDLPKSNVILFPGKKK
jgi:hypothetical protein